jgi:hypothetical protein
MPTKKIFSLPPEVAEKYHLKHAWEGSARRFFGRYGWVDITKLTLARADSLYARGWRKIVLKPVAAAKPSAETKESKK